MEIRDVGGIRFLRLEPFSYQFAAVRGDPFDDNWLVVNGKARSDSEQWRFQEPCLLVGEALALSEWLRRVASGDAEPMAPDDAGRLRPTVEHVEPNVGFGLVRFAADLVVLRVFLWLESGPPSARTESRDPDMEWFMDLAVPPAALRAAAAAWDVELERFPQRAAGR